MAGETWRSIGFGDDSVPNESQREKFPEFGYIYALKNNGRCCSPDGYPHYAKYFYTPDLRRGPPSVPCIFNLRVRLNSNSPTYPPRVGFRLKVFRLPFRCEFDVEILRVPERG